MQHMGLSICGVERLMVLAKVLWFLAGSIVYDFLVAMATQLIPNISIFTHRITAPDLVFSCFIPILY